MGNYLVKVLVRQQLLLHTMWLGYYQSQEVSENPIIMHFIPLLVREQTKGLHQKRSACILCMCSSKLTGKPLKYAINEMNRKHSYRVLGIFLLSLKIDV